MIGKLHVWRGERGEQKKEALAQDKIAGASTFDDSDHRWKDASATSRKRAPRLSIARRPFSTIGPSKPGEDPFRTQPASKDLFSNIPAVTSAGLHRHASLSAFHPSRPRPQTADLDHSLHTTRSRSTPPVPLLTDNPHPLPLTIEPDQARKCSSSISSGRPSWHSISDEIKSSYGASIPRPTTTSSGDPPHRRKGSGSLTRRPSATTPSYSLTPTITPQHSRRPSINAVQNNRASWNKSNSTAPAHGFAPRSRASSSARTSISTQITPKANGFRSPIEQTSFLDEVEGTLNATIAELREMQTGIGNDTVSNPATTQRRRPAESPKSAPTAPANQGYFSGGPPYPSTLTPNSLPPTPIVSISEGIDDQAQSILSYDKQKRDLLTITVENDTLKKQLSLLQTRLASNDTIQIERDQFREMYQESQANLQESVKHGQTLIDKLKLSRDKEAALRNNVSELKHRLEEANMHKLDALHHHHELEDVLKDELKLIEKTHKALRKERERVEQKRMSFEADKSVLRLEVAKLPALHQEIAKLRQRPQQSALDEALNKQKAAEERARELEQQHGNGKTDLPSIIADVGFRMEKLQQGLTKKDGRIEELEAANKLLSKNAKVEKNYSNRIRGLERTIAEQHKTFRTIQAERDQLRQLIYTEFRRTANEVQKRQHPVTALLEKKVDVDTAVMEVRKRAQEFLRSQKRREGDPTVTRALRIEELQQEIDYHVKDIILYKLDVKGYKKDLKRAQTKLARLEVFPGHGLMSQYSFNDSNTTRRSMSPTDSEKMVAQAVGEMAYGNDVLSTDEEVSPLRQERGSIASVYYSPDGSPASTPEKEKKGLNL
ncbi:hypothetical protein E2P81_ATG07139 [Venturia nashicola]|uniref:Uncharacterized protein n=1 Tax=Venturia nashicola TaxID=86259 RepID=A0A4Z1NJT7_9PEZI|nr:hypothetical protein E6O75_ATG07302 [Venturia nashicola]TLD19522.1 hypothetical protein E2P81_ATG07139 [Venturia nashicola]